MIRTVSYEDGNLFKVRFYFIKLESLTESRFANQQQKENQDANWILFAHCQDHFDGFSVPHSGMSNPW